MQVNEEKGPTLLKSEYSSLSSTRPIVTEEMIEVLTEVEKIQKQEENLREELQAVEDNKEDFIQNIEIAKENIKTIRRSSSETDVRKIAQTSLQKCWN